MSLPAIEVRQVYKKFRRGESFDSLRDFVGAAFRGKSARRGLKQSEFWALHGVDFEVQPGEALGVIGPNGAGKSTLLKLLAGIMRPDRGELVVRGKISPLIELGAGFHGDLTGRENIALNASILGISRSELRRKFNDIVDFAGIGEFLNTPVKRYSSGMHARLGFSIAVHADPQVLVVDEVLSVGDRVFRARCMEKMRRFLDQGTAVVFVSHDLSSVNNFCHRTLVLSKGQTIFSGASSEAVRRYYEACSERVMMKRDEQVRPVVVSNIRFLGPDGQETSAIAPGERAEFCFDVSFHIDMPRPSYGLSAVRADDQLVLFETSSARLGTSCRFAREGEVQSVRYAFTMNVAPGEYAIGLHVRDRDALDYAAENVYAARIFVEGKPVSGGLVHLDPHVSIDVARKPAEARLVAAS